MKKYYPYKSDKPDKKYFIITNKGQRVYFGAAGYEDFTTHKDEERKQRYIVRHKKNEDWTDINIPGFWSYHYLWEFPTKKEAYENIKKNILINFFYNIHIIMQVEGVTVQKIIEAKLLGVHKAHNVWLCHGKYGDYLRYNSVNYSLPAWAKMENLNEPFGIAHATKILDWKIMNNVPRGEAGCKPIEDPILLGVHNGHDVWFCNGKYSKYIKYNGTNFSIPGMPKDYNLKQTFDYAIKTFKWDENF